MERISPHQFMTLGSAVLLGTTFLPVASVVTGVVGRDGWISVLPGFVGIPYGLMAISLLEQYPQRNLLQIAETLLGKWIGKIIGSIFIFITGYLGGLLLGQVGDIYQASVMPLTSLWVFYIGALFLILLQVNSGIEVLARFSEVIFPLIVIALLFGRGPSLIMEIGLVDEYLIMPFVFFWVPTLLVVSRLEKESGCLKPLNGS